MRAQANILMDHTGRARITDFGISTVSCDLDLAPDGHSDEHGHTARWTAPEILNEKGAQSKEADVFAFAMVMIEVSHKWEFSSGLRLLPSRIITGVHRRCSFCPQPACSRYYSYYEGYASHTTNSPRVHGRAVGVDATLLECGPLLASRGFRDIKGSWYHVSPSLFYYSGVLKDSSNP